MRLICATALTLALAAAGKAPAAEVVGLASEPPAFSFRTYKIGDDAAAAIPIFRTPKKTRLIGGVILTLECDSGKTPGAYCCPDVTSLADPSRSGLHQLGGVFLGFVNLEVFEGRIYGVSAMAHVNYYPELRSMLIRRYGPPQLEREGTVQNRLGATFANTVTDWTFKEGTLRLDQRGWDVDHASLKFINPEVEAKLAGRRREDAEARGRSAF